MLLLLLYKAAVTGGFNIILKKTCAHIAKRFNMTLKTHNSKITTLRTHIVSFAINQNCLISNHNHFVFTLIGINPVMCYMK